MPILALQGAPEGDELISALILVQTLPLTSWGALRHFCGWLDVSVENEEQLEQTNSMNIAQVAPLYESVPPRLYGGTERVVSYLTEELVRQGHDVTLFARAASETRAKLVPISQRALRLEGP